ADPAQPLAPDRPLRSPAARDTARQGGGEGGGAPLLGGRLSAPPQGRHARPQAEDRALDPPSEPLPRGPPARRTKREALRRRAEPEEALRGDARFSARGAKDVRRSVGESTLSRDDRRHADGDDARALGLSTQRPRTAHLRSGRATEG